MRRGEIIDRADPIYFLRSSLLRAMRFPAVTLGSAFHVRDGDHNKFPDSASVPGGGKGVRYLRAQDLCDGEIDDSNPILVSEKYFEGIGRSHIRPGYLLFSIMASIGNMAVVPKGFPVCTANRAVGILVPKTDDTLLTQFVFSLFSTELGAELYSRIRKGGLQQRTNLKDVEQLEIPVPPEKKQRELVAAIEAARAARRAKLAEADSLLASLDRYLLDTLGLTPPPPDTRKVFSISIGAVAKRLDPHFHIPHFAQIDRLLATAKARPLGSLTKFSKETWEPAAYPQPTFRYLEISKVDTGTGAADWEEVTTAEAPSRARMAVKEGDIIVSLTRPHHGAIAQVTKELDGCVASTGFAVLRGVDEKHVRPDYLWCALRTQLCLQQMLQRSSGGNYPAITEAELANVSIPVPDLATQTTIAAEVRRRRETARRLRAEAESGWAEAKRWFEDQLLGTA